MSLIALIPARAGSQRIPHKNIRPLAGHPLIAYTIAAAQESRIFDAILVSSDSDEALHIARQMGVEALRRPAIYATAESPDIEWVKHALCGAHMTHHHDYFAILRPTSPFRSAKTIRRAWAEFERSEFDCLRAVQGVSEHPWKMWIESNCELIPLMWQTDTPPQHSRPTQTLPKVVVQNASLEMAKCSLVRDRLYPSICTGRIWAFHNPPPEGFDLNTPDQWAFAEMQSAKGEWALPTIDMPVGVL